MISNLYAYRQFRIKLLADLTLSVLPFLILHFIAMIVPFEVSADGEILPYSAESRSRYGLGPIAIEDQFPLSQLHLSLQPESAETLSEGRAQIKFAYLWSNTFAEEDAAYIIDAESRVLNFQLKYGVTDDLELSARVPWIWRGGGVLDGFIDSYHQFFGMPEGGRDRVPRDQYSVRGITTDRSLFRIEDSGSALGDLTISSKYQLVSPAQDKTLISLIGELRLPTASNSGYGQGAVDLLLGMLASEKLNDFVFHGGAGYILFLDDSIDRLTYERNHLQAFFTVEYLYTENLSLQIGNYAATRLVRNVERFGEHSWYLDAGFKYRFAPRYILEALLRENLTELDATTDVTFLIGLAIEL